MLNKQEILTLDDNKEYCVMDTFSLNNKNYAYLFEINNPTNVMCARVENDEIVLIEDEEELKSFLDRLKEDI